MYFVHAVYHTSRIVYYASSEGLLVHFGPLVRILVFQHTRAKNMIFAYLSRERKWYFRLGYCKNNLSVYVHVHLRFSLYTSISMSRSLCLCNYVSISMTLSLHHYLSVPFSTSMSLTRGTPVVTNKGHTCVSGFF